MKLSKQKIALLTALALLAVPFLVANDIAWLRLKPEVEAVTWIDDKPDYEAHLLNIFDRANTRAKGSSDSFLPIYDIQNPGFFLLVAELYARAGATTPLPLQITSIALFDIAAISFFFWVYLLFGELIVATFATAFLVLSQFFLFFPGVTHTFPYDFCFFNLTMLFYVLFLKNNKKGYLVAALVAMFMTCMNYWFYYMSSWIIMIGLWWQYRGRPSIKEVALISAPPVAAASLTAIMVMALFGIEGGIMRLASVLVARLVDARIPGGTWYPDQKFMGPADWHHYPSTVVTRLDWSYSIDFYWFAAAAALAFILLWSRNRKAVVTALILLVGGFSWYYVMFQHTHIHWFTGQYSFMAICPIFGLIMSETLPLTLLALRLTSTAGLELIGRTEDIPELASQGNPVPAGRTMWSAPRIVIAALLLIASWKMVYGYAANTLGLIKETRSIAGTVTAKYRAAVQAICREHPEVTLPELQAASKDWGINWRPELITAMNQAPKCPR